MIIKRKADFIQDLAKKRIKGMKPKAVEFLNSNLKKVNEWSKPGHYSSDKVKNTREATLKRIGRAEATKMSDKEFAKEISRLMKL